MVTNNPPTVKSGRSFAMLKNVIGCVQLVDRLLDRPPNTDGIAVMHGFSGYGKSEAAKYVRNRTRGIKIDVYDSWNRRTFVQAILSEAGFPNQKGTVAQLVDHAILVLSEDTRRPLIIDEADTAFERGFMGIVRQIHDVGKVPVLLVGEELLPKRMTAIERLHGRVFDYFGAEPCDLPDARKLADLFLTGVDVDDTLLNEVQRQGDYRVRRIVNSLNRMAEFARNAGLSRLDLSNYGGGFSTNSAPSRVVSDNVTAKPRYLRGAAA